MKSPWPGSPVPAGINLFRPEAMQMNRWEQQFSEQMDALCAQSSSWFQRFTNETLEPVFETVSEFVARWHYEVTTPACEPQRRAFRFGLTENGYLLIWFKLEGFDALECEYEYSLPGVGRVSGVRTTGSLREAGQEWVEGCFQMALNTFVARFVEIGNRAGARQPALV